MTDRVKVRFICRDRGQHREVELGYSLGWEPSVQYRVSSNLRVYDDPVNERGEWVAGRVTRGTFAFRADHGRILSQTYVLNWRGHPQHGDLVEFLCPKCGRNPKRKLDLFTQDMERLRAAEITEVDISLLPF